MTQPNNNRIRQRRDCQMNVRPIESLEQRLMLSDGAFLHTQRDLDHGPLGPNVRLNVARRGLRAPSGEVLLDITASSLAGDQLNPKRVLFRGRNRPEIVQQVRDVPGGSSSSVLAMAAPGNYIMRMQTDHGDSGGYAIDAALAGDVNGDFQVTRKDLRTIARGISEKSGVEQYMATLDIDHDGTITNEDVAMARRNLGVRITPVPHRLEDPSHHGIYTVPGAEAQPADLTFDWLYRRASFRHEVGVFRTDDIRGTIDGMSPGDRRYTNAAMSSDRRIPVFVPTDRVGSTKQVQLDPGTNFGIYMISNISESTTSASRINRLIKQGRVFFSLDEANKNSFAHFKGLSGNRFAFEDQSGGGDRDFNDFIGRIRFPEPEVDPDSIAPRIMFDQIPDQLGNMNVNLSGLAIDGDSGIASAEYRVDGGDIVPLPLDSNDGFDIVTSLSMDGNQDGRHTIRVRATDNAGNRSGFFPWNFDLDTLAPNVSVRLDSANEVYSNTTVAASVSLIGQTEPNLEVTLNDIGLTAGANSSGGFRFDDVPIPVGTTMFRVTTKDKAGNQNEATTDVTRLEPGALSIQAQLVNDTAPHGQNNDTVTSDPSVDGSIESVHPIASLHARVSNIQTAFVLADQWLDASNNFTFDRNALETILGDVLSDGTLNVEIVARDVLGNLSSVTAVPLILDTSPPTSSLGLDPASDSGVIGDNETDEDSVILVGQTEPHVHVELSPNGLITSSNSLGQFAWNSIALVDGPNEFSITTTDIAGNSRTTDFTFERVPVAPILVALLANDTAPTVDPERPDCAFDDDLTGWTTSASDSGHGGVLASGCSAILVEEDAFTVTLSHELTVPDEPSVLQFSYRDLSFDTTDEFIRDAFEVSLVDDAGQSVVHTIGSGRDAFFNMTEGLTAQLARDVQVIDSTVMVPIPSTEIGKTVRLSFQLINNDGDTKSTVRINDVSLQVVGQNEQGLSQLGGDHVTSDISISGTIASEVAIAQLKVGLDGTATDEYQDVLPDVDLRSDGSFYLSMSLIDRITPDGIPDGQHTLHLVAVAEGEVESNAVDLSFVLDTTTPTVSATVLHGEGAIEINFDEIVNEISSNIQSYLITDQFGDQIAIPDSLESIDAQTVRVTLPSDLPNGNYLLGISNQVRDGAGNPIITGRSIPFDILRPASSVIELSPHSGEELVSPERKPVVRFNSAIDPLSIDNDSFYVIANGERVSGTIKVSSTNLFAAFIPDQPFEPSTEVRVVLDGDKVIDASGNPVDGNRNGIQGGLAVADFRTLPLTRISGTNVFGYIYDSYNKNPDGSDRPVVGATIRVDAFPAANAVTDENGFFELVGMPAPDFFVHIDGSTAINAPSGTQYPVVGKPFHSVPGQRTQLTMDGEVFSIYLPPMAESDVQPLSSTEDTTVGFGDSSTAQLVELFPAVDPTMWDQVSVVYPAGSAQDNAGNAANRAAIIPVPPDRIPAPLPPGLESSLVISVQAQTDSGESVTSFDVPAPVSFPNLDGVPPGEKALLMSFNHAAGRWEATGTMTSNGNMVVSDPGSGIRAPGWHLALRDGVVFTGGQVLATRGGLFGRTGSDRLAPQTGTHDYAIEDLASGLVIRGTAQVADKLLEQVILSSDSTYRLSVLQRSSLRVGEVEFDTGLCQLAPANPTLCQSTLPTVILDHVTGADSDSEGLLDKAEFILGTAINNPDTDGDGISDLAEIRQRTDPFNGQAFPTGVIADLRLRGEAHEVVVEESTDGSGRTFAYVATGGYGLAIVDVTQFDLPVVLGQIELVGNAIDVAVDQQLGIAAVVSEQTGLSLVDISDPMTPQIHDTISLPFTSVAVLEGQAFAGTGVFVNSYDLLSGERLESIPMTQDTVKDLAIEGSMLYAIDDSNITAIEITALGMTKHSSLALPDVTHSLFVGNDIAYISSTPVLGLLSGYATVDVGDPDNLRLLSRADNSVEARGDLALNGSGLGVMVNNGNQVWVLDTSDPLITGDTITAFDPPAANAGPDSVAIAAGIALATNDSSGLFVVNYLSFDSAGTAPTVTAQLFDDVDLDPTRNGIQLQEGQTVTVRANVNDDVQARSTELLVNGRVVSSDVSFPWNLGAELPEIRDGITTAQLQIRATDTGGNVGLSSPINIELVPDTFAPGIASVSPNDGQLRSTQQRTVRIVFTESMDADTLTSANIQLRGPGGVIQEPTVVQTRVNDQVVQFDYTSLSVGEYTILMNGEKLTDRAGNRLGDAIISSRFEVVNASAVWTNPAGGFWDDPLNWDVERVPGPEDDVLISIPGNVPVTHRDGDSKVRSLITTNPFVHEDGSFEAETIELFSTMTILSGTLVDTTIRGNQNGNVSIVTGVPASPFVRKPATLNNVTLDVDLAVQNTSSQSLRKSINIFNGLTINQSFLVGTGSRLRVLDDSLIDGSGTLHLSGGLSFFHQAVQISLESNTVTFGPDLTVSGETADIVTGTLINHGRILGPSENQTLSVRTELFNRGILGAMDAGKLRLEDLQEVGSIDLQDNSVIEITGGTYEILEDAIIPSGATLKLGGNWKNSSTIGVTSGVLDLSGVFSASDVGRIVRSNSRVQVSGLLDNTDDTLILDNTTGDWHLVSGAQLRGGTIVGRDGASLRTLDLGFNASMTLDGLTLDIDLVVQNTSSQTASKTLTIRNGLTINRTLFVGTGTNVRFTNDLVLDGVGQIRLEGGLAFFFKSVALSPLGNTVTIGPELTMAASQVSASNGTFINQGTVVANTSGVTFRLDAEFLNQGTISAINGGVLRLTDLRQFGQIDLHPNSEIRIDGGSYEILDDVSIADGSMLTIGGDWQNSATINVDDATLDLSGTFSAPDVGQIVRSGNSRVQVSGLLDNAGQTLVLDTTTGSWYLVGGAIVRGGTIEGRDGVALLGTPGTVTHGTPFVLDNVTLDIDLTIPNAHTSSGLNRVNVHNGLTINRTLFVGSATNLTFNHDLMVDGDGTLVLNGISAPFNAQRVTVSGSGQTITFGPDLTIEARQASFSSGSYINNGTLRASTAAETVLFSSPLTNNGVLAATPGATIRIDTPLDLPQTSEVVVDLAGVSSNQFGRFDLRSDVTFAGTLTLSLVNGFEPLEGNSFPIFSGGTRLADSQFDQIDGTVLPNGLVFNPIYNNEGLTLVAAQPLSATGPTGDSAGQSSITSDQLEGIVDAAIDRWISSGINPEAATWLDQVTFRLDDLPGNYVGFAARDIVWIDETGAGRGWFVDESASIDEEFETVIPGKAFQALTGQEADEKLDLLTAVAHELGHVLGLHDLDPGDYPYELLAGSLDVGQRRIPTTTLTHSLPPVSDRSDLPPVFGHMTIDDEDGLTNRGREFWLTFPTSLALEKEDAQLSLRITGSSLTSGIVEIPGLGFRRSFNVFPNEVTEVLLPREADLGFSSTQVTNKGIHVTASAAVAVFAVSQAVESTDAFLGLPTPLLGTDYIVLAYENSDGTDQADETFPGTEFALVATTDNTNVSVTPSVTSAGNLAGTPYLVTLNRGETYLLQNSGFEPSDLTGTIVTSDHPIAVFGAHAAANVPTPAVGFADFIVEQLPPTNAWGNEFITTPLANRTGGDTFRILAAENATSITINGQQAATIDRGEIHEQIIDGPAAIRTSGPALVAQFAHGARYDQALGDPFMMLVPATDQFLPSYTIASGFGGLPEHYSNIVVSDTAIDSTLLDGQPIPASMFTAIGTTGFSMAQLELTNDVHHLSGPLPFAANVYGFGQDESYGYPAGWRVNPPPSPTIAEITLSPDQIELFTSTIHTAVATVLDENGEPVLGIDVAFVVTGANESAGTVTTNIEGKANFSYSGLLVGTDQISANVANLADTASVNWIAGAPTILVDSPLRGSTFEVGSQVLISGQAMPGGVGVELIGVSVNGEPVDTFGSNNEFFEQATVVPGDNTFVFTVTDELGQTAETTLNLFGTQNELGVVEFDMFRNEVTNSFAVEYGHTSFNDTSKELFIDLAVRNTGQFPLDAPLLVGIDRLSNPSVRVRGYDGITPNGIPYFDLSDLIQGNSLEPNELTQSITVRMFNPGDQFNYDLVFFAQVNEAPRIVSIPTTEAVVGSAYQYQVTAMDPDGDQLEFKKLAGPEELQVDPTSGQTIWLPTNDDLGTHVVVIESSDDRGGRTEQHFVLGVINPPTNRPPVFQSIPIVNANVGSEYLFQPNVSDADGDTISYALTDSPQAASIHPDSGLVTWLPAAGQLGLQTFEIQADDGQGGISKQTYEVAVGGEIGNRAPVISSLATSTALENRDYEYQVRAFDPDNDALTINLAFAPVGMTIDETGFVEWSGADVVIGVHIVEIRVNDGHGGLDVQTFSLDAQAEPANSDPMITSIPPTEARVDGRLGYFVIASDPDHDSLAYSVTGPVGMTIGTGGLLQWIPSDSQLGTSTVTVTVQDNRGGIAEQSFDIEVLVAEPNTDPAIISSPVFDAIAERLYEYQVISADAEGDLLNYALLESPEGMTIDSLSGLIRWTPSDTDVFDPDEGLANVEIQVMDGRGGSHLQQYGILVRETDNLAPVITSPFPEPAVVGELFRHELTAEDPDNDQLRFELEVAPDGMTIDPETGVIAWRPTSRDALEVSHQVVVSASDQHGGVDIQFFPVLVINANSRPIITSQPGLIAAVDRPYEYRVQAHDADGDSITYRLDASSSGMTIDPSSGVFTWTPTSAQLGDHTVTVHAFDGQLDAETLFANHIQTFGITVVPTILNEPPVIVSNPRNSVRQDGLYLYQVNVQDPNADPINYALDFAPGSMSIDNDGLITWRPPSNSVGRNFVELRVDDNHGGTDTQSFTIDVTSTEENRDPIIISNPVSPALIDQSYHYNLMARDPDGDTVVWDLAEAPAGMSINETTGALRWVPTELDIATHSIIVQARDFYGGVGEQTYDLVVRPINSPPVINSSPPTEATVDVPYVYAVRATDFDMDTLNYSLVNGPSGMQINPSSGLIIFVGDDLSVGIHPVSIEVDDGLGGKAVQEFDLNISESNVSGSPSITSIPPLIASLGELYEYPVTAFDPDGDDLAFSLVNAPTGMAIDSITGRIQWSPTIAQLGSANVTISVSDGSNIGTQNYGIEVRPANTAPVINSQPNDTVVAGSLYRYDVLASDPDGDRLSFELLAGPGGMSVDSLGMLRFETSSADIGVQRAAVRVSDDRGGIADQSFEFEVVSDIEAPQVEVLVSDNPVQMGTSVTIIVQATDNVRVASRGITIDGVSIPLDSNGRGTLVAESPGLVQIAGSATDSSGNVGTSFVNLVVIDPTDAEAPIVSIVSPEQSSTITTFTDVVGTVLDDNLVSYTLEVAPFGGEFQEIGSGTNSIQNDVIGVFDPTMLQNDVYVLRLSALDAGGNRSTVVQNVSVAGNLKLGEFQVSFLDLAVPVEGIPVQILRTFDSLTAEQQGEVGFGWRIEIRDTDLRTSVPKTGNETFGIFAPFAAGDRVYVTLPGGERLGFTFEPQDQSICIFSTCLNRHEARFIPDPGVTSELTVDKVDLTRRGNEYFSLVGNLPFNPEDGAFGGRYYLTTFEGVRFEINAANGDLNRVTNRQGAEVVYREDGIFSNRGVNILFERDARGRITSLVDPSGAKVSYEYDGEGDLVVVTDRMGNRTTFGYSSDRPHYLEQITDPLGRSGSRMEYDEAGRLSSITDPLGNTTEYTFDLDTSIIQTIDPLGNTTTVGYDAEGNVTTFIDPEGGTTEYEHDAQGNLLSIVDALGNETLMTYDANRMMTSARDPLGNVQRLLYDEDGNLIGAVDPLGNTIQGSYNDRGAITSAIDPDGNQMTFGLNQNGYLEEFVDLSGITYSTQFDQRGAPILLHDALGNEIVQTYDANGRLVNESRMVTVGGEQVGVSSSTEYDLNGKATSVVDPLGARTQFEYDPRGLRTATIDPLGRRSEFTYDDRGQLVRTDYPDGLFELIEYDKVGRAVLSQDRAGRQTRFEYDRAGRVTEVIYPDETPESDLDNPRIKNEYDLVGRVIATADELGKRYERTFDAAGNEIETRDPLGNTLRREFDPLGRVSAYVDPEGMRTSFEYDPRGLLVSVIHANGLSTSTEYDSLGFQIASVDLAGIRTQYERDETGRLTAVVDANGQRTEYQYDELGRLTTQIDANDRSTAYEYDLTGRQTAVVLPLGQRSEVQYDLLGKAVSVRDFNGDLTVLEYDSMNRLTKQILASGQEIEVSYSPVGLRESVSDINGVTTYTYDARDRLTSKVQVDGRVIGYAYDLAGNIITTTTPGGSRSFEYDELNRLTAVVDPEGDRTQYTWDAVGNRILTLRPDGSIETRSYNSLHRLVAIDNRLGDELITSFAYTLDAAGNRLAVVEADGTEVNYEYDSLYRLTKETIFKSGLERSKTYGYDAVGNRVRLEDSQSGITTYEYDENNRLIRELAPDGETTYSYDDNGNRFSETTADTTTAYDWDDRGRLATVDSNGDGSPDVIYEYNPDGIMIARTEAGHERRMLVDGNRRFAEVLEEYDNTGLLISHTYGLERISISDGNTKSLFHYDGLGSTRVLTGLSGSITDRYEFDALGRVTNHTGDNDTRFLFLGEAQDPTTNWTYLRSRHLDTSVGGFTSGDPFGGSQENPLSLNRYLYVHGNPVNHVDPSGEFLLLEFALKNILEAIGRGIEVSLRAMQFCNSIQGMERLQMAMNLIQVFAYFGAQNAQILPNGLSATFGFHFEWENYALIDTSNSSGVQGTRRNRLAQLKSLRLGFARGVDETHVEYLTISASAKFDRARNVSGNPQSSISINYDTRQNLSLNGGISLSKSYPIQACEITMGGLGMSVVGKATAGVDLATSNTSINASLTFNGILKFMGGTWTYPIAKIDRDGFHSDIIEAILRR